MGGSSIVNIHEKIIVLAAHGQLAYGETGRKLPTMSDLLEDL